MREAMRSWPSSHQGVGVGVGGGVFLPPVGEGVLSYLYSSPENQAHITHQTAADNIMAWFRLAWCREGDWHGVGRLAWCREGDWPGVGRLAWCRETGLV